MMEKLTCWCGSDELVSFSAEYFRCSACETFVSARMPGPEISRVVDEERDLYGREYWFSHQEQDLGQPSILVRARADLPERCLHWLRTLLKYKLPPGRILEIGSGHGGFVAMLRWAGFEASGLEISPWVVEFARETFQVPVLCGRVEDQAIAPASLDAIILMDVLEHLRDPVNTMRHCLDLLKPDGILLIQTPCYPEGTTYAEMSALSDRLPEILKATEHLYLFSRRSVGDFFGRVGAAHVAFEPAFFPEYDMFLVVSRGSVPVHAASEGEQVLGAAPGRRLIRALVDLGVTIDAEVVALRRHVDMAEADRAARLAVIGEQGRRLGEVEAERNNLAAEVVALRRHLEVAEADRAARLTIIEDQGRRLEDQGRRVEEQGRRLSELEAERNDLATQVVAALERHLEVAEADRAARLAAMEEQARRPGQAERNNLSGEVTALLDRAEVERRNLQVEVQAQREQIQMLMIQIRVLQRSLQRVKGARGYRLLRRLGRWKFVDQMAEESPVDSAASPSRASGDDARRGAGRA